MLYMYSSILKVVLYTSVVLGAHGSLGPRFPKLFVSNDINIIHKLTANTITTGANIILMRSPILYLSMGTLSNNSPIESLNDRLSTKNGDNAITTRSMPTLTSITRAVSSMGRNSANASIVLMMAWITNARSSPFAVSMLNCAKLRIDEYSVINGHIMPLLESKRFFIVRTPVSLNVSRQAVFGILYSGAIPKPSLTSSDAGLLISNIACASCSTCQLSEPVLVIAAFAFCIFMLYSFALSIVSSHWNCVPLYDIP